ncbi:hypothetical protein [Parenemella sanctibonifatiensis]|uniref:Uncharacterized protein n=1 Tax=Parenemella sanctibonifatiensis TaxID=2016505 RepID=A0A255ELL1_9ACTN|nr:hypothetical protein [Parenemella sanctibonifatiensis]OYN92417.1 hypothetical protein CGZ91_02680 [Parenemella sanctibonifatiensis]
MAEQSGQVPVWTLATEAVAVPEAASDGDMTPERLADMRTALASFAQTPITTLEMHPITRRQERSGGIALHAASPLAQQLSQLVAQTARSTPSKAGAAPAIEAAGEVLYRMVVPAKVAEQVGQGLVKSMTSKAVPGGVHSAMMGAKGIVAQATFMPVARALAGTAGAGVAGAGTAGAGTAGAGIVASTPTPH